MNGQGSLADMASTVESLLGQLDRLDYVQISKAVSGYDLGSLRAYLDCAKAALRGARVVLQVADAQRAERLTR